MEITGKQIKKLARLLSDASELSYMIALDRVAETLSGHKWNVLKTKLPDSDAVSEVTLRRIPESTAQESSHTSADTLINMKNNITNILPLSPHENDLIAHIRQCMDGFIPCESLMRWLFAREARMQPISGGEPRLTYCEIFANEGFVSLPSKRHAEEKLKVFKAYPALMLVLVDAYFKKWSSGDAQSLNCNLLSVSSAETTINYIHETLIGVGYSEGAISLMKCPHVATDLSKLLSQKRDINIPPPSLLNPCTSSHEKRCKTQAFLRDSSTSQRISLFEFHPRRYMYILRSIRTADGLDDIFDWSGVRVAISRISADVGFASYVDSYVSNLFMGWSPLFAFSLSPAIHRAIAWLKYRDADYGNAPYTGRSDYYARESIMELSLAGYSDPAPPFLSTPAHNTAQADPDNLKVPFLAHVVENGEKRDILLDASAHEADLKE